MDGGVQIQQCVLSSIVQWCIEVYYLVDDWFVVFGFVDLEVWCISGIFNEIVFWVDQKELWCFVVDLVVNNKVVVEIYVVLFEFGIMVYYFVVGGIDDGGYFVQGGDVE